MTLAPGTSPSRVVELLDEQLELYQRLKELTEHQSMMVAQHKPEPLLEVLAQRQRVLDQIDGLNREITPHRQQWQAVKAGLDADQREHVDLRVQQVENLLAAIIDQDEKDRQQLASSHAQVSEELGKTRHAGTAIRAYRQASGYRPGASQTRQG